MTWAQAIHDHEANARVDEARSHLEQLRQSVHDAASFDLVARADLLLTEARGRLDLCIPAFVTPQMLGSLVGSATQIVNAEVALLAEGDQLASLAALEAPIEQLAITLADWPTLPDSEEAGVMESAIRNLNSTAQAALDDLNGRVHGLRSEAGKVQSALAQLEQDNAQTAQQSTDRLTELEGIVEQQKQEIVQAQAAYQTQFESDQGNRGVAFEGAIQDFDIKRNEAIQRFDEQRTEAADRAQAEAEERLDQLTELHDKASDLVGTIGRTGMTGGYQQDANKEEKAANRWRTITVVAAAAAIVALIWAVRHAASSQEIDGLVARTLLSVAFGGLATYTAKQSGHHRTNARVARNMELTLASIGPYLEAIDPDRKQQVLEAFAFILFAQTPPGSSSKKDDDNVASGPSISQIVVEQLLRRQAE